MVDNYFKVNADQVFAFDENNPRSVRGAWSKAQAVPQPRKICLYRPVPVPGDWSTDVAEFVGHRAPAAILADLEDAETRLGTVGLDLVFEAMYKEQREFAIAELKAHPLSIG